MPKHILVVKLSAIGDVTLSLPFFAALKERDANCQVTVLIGEAAGPLLECNPAVDRQIVVDEKIFWQRHWRKLARLFWRLKREKVDAVYILHWSRWFHVFFWLMGIPERIGFARDGMSFRLTRAVPYVEGSADIHETHQYLRLIDDRLLDQPLSNRPPTLYFSQSEIKTFSEWTYKHGFSGDRPWIAVAPGGGDNIKLFMPQKRWPAANFAELLLRLATKNNSFIVVLGNASEKDLLKPWSDQLSIHNYFNAAGEMSLRQTAWSIQQCKLFIGNDSGLLHIAGAVKTPSVSFFGPTSPKGKLPDWSLYKNLYTNESCSPCYKYGQAPPCPYDLKCLRKISVDEAYASAVSLLAASCRVP